MTDEVIWHRYGDRRPRIHDIVVVEGDPEPDHRIMVGSEGWHGRLKSLGDELRYRIIDEWTGYNYVSKPLEAEKCGNCRFFYAQISHAFEKTDGVCRRYAPRGTAIHVGAGWSCFPPTMQWHWCGDYGRQAAMPEERAQRAANAA